MAELLKGAPAATALTELVRARSDALRTAGIDPTLAILRVGEDESDLSYERGALKRAEKAGVAVRQIVLPRTVSQTTLLDEIQRINEDDAVHGCLMFRPLPKDTGLNREAACEALSPAKDVDGMTSGSLAAVFTGHKEGFAPCTAAGCLALLDHYGIELTGKRAVVIGRSLVIGRPLAMMLMARNATVTICHTKTRDLASVCREADVLVAAAGEGGIVQAAFTHPGQIVVDVGINVDSQGCLCGDVDFGTVEPHCAAITPVPGGVGALTTAVLCSHVIEAAERRSTLCFQGQRLSSYRR